MPIQVHKIEDRPAILIEYTEPFDPIADMPVVVQQSMNHYDPALPRFFVIHDALNVTLDFTGVIAGVTAAAKPVYFDEFLLRPGVQLIFVLNAGTLTDIATEAIARETDGMQQVHICATREAALDYIDAQQ